MDRHFFIKACRDGGTGLDYVLRLLDREFHGLLMRDAMLSLGNFASAQDVVQDTLIKVWSQCHKFEGRSELLTWVRSILRHALIDRWRAWVPEEPELDAQGETSDAVEAALQRGTTRPTVENLVHSQELERIYRSAFARFARVHPMEANVIRWIAEDGLTIDELAHTLQRSPKATRQYVSQCRKKARPYLQQWYLLASADDSHAPRSAKGSP